MRIAVGSDERNETTDAVVAQLAQRGIDVELFGPLNGEIPSDGAPDGASMQWAEVSADVARAVARGDAQCGIVCCWTGTGASIAANKVDGIRAALCVDAETARGARQWNDANVLALSLRLSSPETAREIVDAFLDTTEVDPNEWDNIRRLSDLE